MNNNAREEVRGLPKKWRAVAHELRYNPAAMPVTATAYETCADELESALAADGGEVVAWPHEVGPWANEGGTLYSGDFRHDAALTVTGDFASDDDRNAYCDWLAEVLNTATLAKLPPPADAEQRAWIKARAAEIFNAAYPPRPKETYADFGLRCIATALTQQPNPVPEARGVVVSDVGDDGFASRYSLLLHDLRLFVDGLREVGLKDDAYALGEIVSEAPPIAALAGVRNVR